MSVRAESEKDGSFVLAGVQKRAYRVSAGAEGYSSSDIEAEPADAALVLVLEPEARIVGTVVDEAGRPVPNCRALARPSDRDTMDSMIATATDVVSAGGRFEMTRVRPGTFIVELRAADHIDKTVSDVKVTAGRTTDVGKIVLPAGGSVKGLVTDRGGAPVAGATVELHKQYNVGFGGGPERREASTDAGGRFELKGLPIGVTNLKARHRMFAPSTIVEVDVDPAVGPAEARITLLEGGTVQGTARRRDGKPVANAMVHVNTPGASFGASTQAAVRADGTFVVEHASPGKAQAILLIGNGGHYTNVINRDIDVRDGETTNVDLTLTDVRVLGRVTRGGKAVSGHRIEFLSALSVKMGVAVGGALLGFSPPSPGPERGGTTTGADGGYELLVPTAGKYRVMVSSLGRERTASPAQPEIVVPDGETFAHDVALPDWALVGTVVDKESGRPIDAARVEVRPPGGEPGGASVTTAADGRFQLAVEPGAYRVKVLAPKYVMRETDMTLGGVVAERTFDLDRGGTLKGRVITAGGQGIDLATVVALSPGGASARTTRSRIDGSFDVEGVTTGSYQIFAAHELGFAIKSEASFDAGPTDLAVSPGTKVRIRVKNAQARALGDTRVRVELLRLDGFVVGLESAGAYAVNVHTDADGGLEMTLPLGKAHVVAWATNEKLRGEAQINVQPQMPDTTIVLKAPR